MHGGIMKPPYSTLRWHNNNNNDNWKKKQVLLLVVLVRMHSLSLTSPRGVITQTEIARDLQPGVNLIYSKRNEIRCSIIKHFRTARDAWGSLKNFSREGRYFTPSYIFSMLQHLQIVNVTVCALNVMNGSAAIWLPGKDQIWIRYYEA